MAGRIVVFVCLIVATFFLCPTGFADSPFPRPGWQNALRPEGKPGPVLTLARDGQAEYVIVLPDRPTSQEKKAAEDLAYWLHEITSADFPVVQESQLRLGSKFFSIGRTKLLGNRSLPDLGDEGYSIIEENANLFLVGGRRRGPINAVYALLEEDLGCRWYDRYEPDIPRLRELRVAIVPRTYKPVLEIRDPFYWDAFDPDWALRNRTNAPLVKVPEEWGGVTDYAWFGHSFDWLVPPSQYFDEHPEYFALVDGRRKATQLCLTNPDVLRITVDKVKARLRNFPHCELISISQNDCTGYCECANCKKINLPEGTPAASLILFCNKVADAIKDEFPNVKVSTLAYLGTAKPPKTVKPNERVIVQLCTDRHAWKRPFLTVLETEQFKSAMKGWHALGAATTIWHYTVNFHHYPVPMPNWQVVDRDIEILIKHGTRGIMLQGAYQSPGGENAVMRSWVWAKKLWDPSLKTIDLLRDFVYGYFREAAEPMWKYQMLLWDIWEQNRRQPSDRNLLMCGIRYYPDIVFLQKEHFLKKAIGLLDEARRLAKDPVTVRRVDLARFPVLYAQISQEIGFVDYYGAFQPRLRAGSDRERLRAILEEFERIGKAEKVTHIREGRPDFEQRLSELRHALSFPSSALHTIKLDESSWRTKADPSDLGFTEQWYAVNFDDSTWRSGSRSDKGTAWYRQRFRVPEEWQRYKHVYVWFPGVAEEALVYLNGKPVWEHSVRTTAMPKIDLKSRPFYFDATGRMKYENNRHPLLGFPGFELPTEPWVKYGEENTIAVRVNSTLGPGGICGPVYLIATDEDWLPVRPD
ncbi:MAG: DUF4838 domain-containing protein [Armatimonadota bacterium]|nr:DUF4838 domain-containing protein [Armatimonadota bacterium]